MTNHEDLMAAALEAVEQAETRANGAQFAELDNGNAADLSSDERSESGMGDTEQAAAFDLDIDLDLDLELSGSDSSLPNLGKDLIAKLSAQKNAKSDAPTVAGAKTPAADKAQSTLPSSKPTSACTTGAQASTTGAQAIPKPAPKIVLPQIGALKSTPNEAQAAQAQTPTQAKYMMHKKFASLRSKTKSKKYSKSLKPFRRPKSTSSMRKTKHSTIASFASLPILTIIANAFCATKIKIKNKPRNGSSPVSCPSSTISNAPSITHDSRTTSKSYCKASK